MADKEVIINGVTLVHGKGVKESLNNSVSSTVCFDEVITEGAENVSYKLTIDRLVFETKDDYEKLRDELAKLTHEHGFITTREIVRYNKSEPFTIVKNYSRVILDGNDYEMKPEEHSAQGLSFICGAMEEYTE